MQNNILIEYLESFYKENNSIPIDAHTQLKLQITADEYLLHLNNESKLINVKKETHMNTIQDFISSGSLKLEEERDNNATFTSTSDLETIIFNMIKILPFVHIRSNNTLEIYNFTTSDLPGHFNNSMRFLKDEFVNKKKIILESPFFNFIYNLLHSMSSLSIQNKRNVLLEFMYLTTRSSTTGTPITSSVATRRLGDTLTWLQEFDLIDSNLDVVNGKLNNPISYRLNFWWVNQGQSAKLQTEGGFLWSPKTDKNGTPLAHHNDLILAKPGDVIFAYSDSAIRSICIVERESEERPKPDSFSSHSNWEEQGNYLEVSFYSLNKAISKIEIPEEWRKNEGGPFDRNGNVKQGYFFKTTNTFSLKILNQFKKILPREILNYLELPEANLLSFSNDIQKINHIHSYIHSKGFYYDKNEISNLYLSLKTKPFVILSGISGTGKTKIVQLLAESLGATDENGQLALIPVRPDWSDGSDLIGYRDIKGDFQEGPLTKVLKEANRPENRNKPYFLLLDEMNLARVEYYFSDVLSVMESRDRKNDEMVSAPVVEVKEADGGKLLLRDNFYIIGTVNMDETTHPFSPKVLDRANTIEYNDVVLDHFGFLANDSIVESVSIDNKQVAGRFLNLKDAFSDHEDLVRKVTKLLVEVNAALEPIKAHFGYRVRDEVCFYMIYNDEGELLEFNEAFDFQLLQKVLPRLTGNDPKTEKALKALFRFCTSHEWDESSVDSAIKEARFPKSAEKLSNMISKIINDGFTSFWGS